MGEVVEYPVLSLRRGEDRRLRAGHPWVFSNEVDTERTPLSEFEPGEAVAVCDAEGEVIGLGYANPNSLICARLLVRGARRPIDRNLIADRLARALALRDRAFAKPFYRLVHGEGDGLPGLVLDRFGQVLVGQIGTAGMERLRPEIEAALKALIAPRALLWKNDSAVRALEGLPERVELAFGTMPDPLIVEEHDLVFAIDPVRGQKTGWYYDQRDNRRRLSPWVEGRRVLDLFCYAGAWGLLAARHGARQVLCIDDSSYAVEAVIDNALRNGLAGKVSAERGEAFEVLRALRADRQRFDVVILDPPAFIKRRKDFKEGAIAYRRLNELALQVLNPGGILVSCSCSFHFGRADLLAALRQAARQADRQLRVLAQLQQDLDHPVHPAIEETDYLKGFLCHVAVP
ncbi:MAG: SAM-dependent methyltransferase [Lysobacterales bacterium]|jgi:23S rRNA (cytosine1962-C5)-methyltransferase|nr:MAG: SAM-dependent methyltransferase [Xanthomonadales bacterium]